jgi:predicted RNA-binding protein (virulence factor B family)
MKIGELNTLSVARTASVGAFLSDEVGMEVLLPKRYVPEGVKEGDRLQVFVYRDSEDRPVATTETPLAKVNQLAFLEVKTVDHFGAFLDWGLPKDLLVPKKEMDDVVSYWVYIYLDQLTQRLVASARLERFLSKRPLNLEAGDQVDILIWKSHALGFQVIVDEEYTGMLYRDQTFKSVQVGDKVVGYVNQVRPDGRLDIILQKPGYAAVDDASNVLIDLLERRNGFVSLTDKSTPDEIQEALGMSKKVFKKAVGQLYRQHIIKLEENGIRLL